MLCIILKKEFPLPEAALRAYRQGLIDYSTGSFVLEQNMRIKWQTLHDAVEKSHLNAALKEIRDYYIYPSNPTITIEQFKFFANMFVQQDIISDYPADVCRRILKPVISDLDILNDHILKNQQYYASIITKAKEDAEMLVDDLRVQGTNNPDNHELSAFLSLIIPPDTSTNGG